MRRAKKFFALGLLLTTFSCGQPICAAENFSSSDRLNYFDQMLKTKDLQKNNRDVYLDYLNKLNSFYDDDKATTSEIISDLKDLKKLNDFAQGVQQQKYGAGFTDFDLMNRARNLLPKIGRRLAEKNLDNLEQLEAELNDPIFYPVFMEIYSAEVQRLKNKFPANSPEVLSAEIKLLNYYSILGYSAEAISLGEKILPVTEKVFQQDSEKILSVMNVLGDEYATTGKFSDCEKIINRRLDFAKKIPNSEEKILAAQNDLVRLYLKQDKYLEGLQLLNEILPAAQNLPNDSATKSKILLSSCIVLDSQGQFENANNLYRKIPEPDLDVTVEKLRVMSDIVRSKIFHGFTLSDDLMLVGTDSALLGNSHHQTLNDLCNLSGDYLKIGNNLDALAVAEKTLQLSRDRYGELHPITIKANQTLANVFRSSGEVEKAFNLDQEVHEKILRVFGKNSAEEIKINLSVAADKMLLGKVGEAKKMFEDNIIKYRKNYGSVNNDLPWTAMNQLAVLCLANGSYNSALELCDNIRASKRNFQSRISTEDTKTLLTTARAYRLSGQLDTAEDYYKKTLTGFEGVRKYSLLTDDYLSEWFAQVVPVYKEQLLTNFENGKSAEEIFLLSDLCKARNLADRYNEYLALAKGGISETEIKQHDEFSAKISVLDEEINSARQSGNDFLYLGLEIAKLRTMLDRQRFKTSLENKYPSYKKAREIRLTDQTSAAEKLSAIPAGSYFIDYTILSDKKNSDKILVTIADREKILKNFTISIDENFIAQCEIYRQILSVNSVDNFQARYGFLHQVSEDSYKVFPTPNENGLVTENYELTEAKKILSEVLGKILLSPLEKNLPPDATDWIICPDGVLATLPFETLQYKNKNLLDSAEISYVPSLSVLKLMSERGEQNKNLNSRQSLFAVGGVDYGRYSATEDGNKNFQFRGSLRGDYESVLNKMNDLKWKFLSASASEVDNVAKFFPNDSTKLEGRDATERKLKQLDSSGELKNYKYLLFATHGMYVPPKPELSSILFRPDDNPVGNRYEFDGYVTVGEWMNYHLNSDLVFLSACESGLGKFQAGEGVVGIPYGLCVAGNKSTIMTLWNIGDKSTEKFTSTFFAKISQGKSAKTALTETKREFASSQQFANPSIWSAFVLYGN